MENFIKDFAKGKFGCIFILKEKIGFIQYTLILTHGIAKIGKINNSETYEESCMYLQK